MLKKISIVIATYNCKEDLKSTLKSLNKDHDKIHEIIFSDGASNDGTVDLINSYTFHTKKIISERDKGIADAWNKGVSMASGDWILFLNAGDYLHHNYFDALNTNELSNTDFLFCDVIRFDPNTNNIVNRINGKRPTLKNIYYGGVGFGHPGSIIKRDLLISLGLFNINKDIAMDSDLILRALLTGCNFSYFKSVAYMATGGVSDIKIYAALKDYYDSFVSLKLLKKWQVPFIAISASSIKFLISLYRKSSVIFRHIKHFIVYAMNFIYSLPLPYFIRKLFFKLFGHKISKSSSIGIGTSFYGAGNFKMLSNSVINRNCLIDNRETVLIGNNVSISRNVSIYTMGHEINSPFFETRASPVTIEDYSVIFSNSLIMPGVKISKGSVILPGSVVTKSTEEFFVYGGNPAIKLDRRNHDLKYNIDYKFPLAM